MTHPEGKRYMVRKNYFIKKAFQAKFIIAFILLLLLEAFLIAALFMRASGGTLTTGFSGSHFVIESTSSFFIASFTLIVLAVGTAIAMAGVLLFLFLSHRIAGPLYRFEKTLAEVSLGNLSGRIRLRKNDQLKKLQGSFNETLEKLDQSIGEIKKELDLMSRTALEIDDEKARQTLEKHISQLKEKISFFRTS